MDERLPERVTYSDNEISRILQRASELQRATPSAPDPSGLTLRDLEEIAREAGIDARHIRQAANEVVRAPDRSWVTRLLGAPLRLRLEREVDGELPLEAFDALVPVLQTGTDGAGHASTVGKALTWTSAGGSNARHLQGLVHVQDGKTLIRLEERSADTAAAFHVGFGAGGLAPGIPAGIAVAVGAGALAGIGVGALVTGGVWAVGRALYKLSTRSRQRTLEAVFQELVSIVESRVSTAKPLPGAADEGTR